MVKNSSDFQREEYFSRINRVFDYIEKNISQQFSLEDLAEVANFSKYHFHRIFYGVVGETPFQFIQRVRLERSASMLITNPKDTIADIAFKVGYTDISIFSRNFKSHFGISATAYKKEKIEKSNNRQKDSKNHQEENKAFIYLCNSTNKLKWRTKMKLNKSVEVKDLQEMNVAYVRHIGAYQGNDKLFEGLWNKIFSWAGPRGLVGGADFMSLVVYHDDPNLCDHNKLRTSVCITVPENTKVDGDVGTMKVEGGKYVVARFDVDASEFGLAWEWLYAQWLPESGYQPDDKACFEMYPEEPKNGRFIVDICVGVKPL